MGFFKKTKQTETNQKRKENYFTASQGQLIRARFKSNRTAMVAGWVLTIMILIGLFAPFLSPYAPSMAGRDKQYENGPPQIPQFWDENGFSFRPFIYGTNRERSIKTNFRWVITVDREERYYLKFFVEDWEYSFINLSWDLPGEIFDVDLQALTFKTHLFGTDRGGIHLFGTDGSGKDIYSRTLHAIYTSLAVGSMGVFIAFVLALLIGGIAGYFGGWIDSVLQMITDAIRTVPPIPLFMALAAFMPDEWSAETRFFFIATILGLIGWPTLARRIRTHLLSERSQEYVLAAELCGASSGHIIRKHLLPSFTSYIIVDLMITFPYMVRSETALSFIGLGLVDPVNSLGALMQNVSKADVLLNYHWYFIPVIFFIAFVLAFVFVGDGLRDASDPYSHVKK
ncbi:MAG: ABC transporter permease [Deltaproteobacteria bacterium]|mgnify:FL=1|jgi:peptide/nickel transport system permease protein|nr:ABC transporter permease [Deltaproteobacteria bacterium]